MWEEDAMVAAAKQIKQKNPATSVIAWYVVIIRAVQCSILEGMHMMQNGN